MRALTIRAAIVLAVIVLASCEVDNPDESVRDTWRTVAGIYTNPDGGVIAEGVPITQLTIIQSGVALQAVDNNGILFTGNMGPVDGSACSITLDGSSLEGSAVVISGVITKSGTEATLRGNWLDSYRNVEVYATATVPQDSYSPTNNVSPSYGPDCSGDYSGCCSSHEGVVTNQDGCVLFDSSGHVRCNDDTISPTCKHPDLR